MSILNKIKDIANTPVKNLFSKKIDLESVKNALIEKQYISENPRDNVENYLRNSFDNDTDAINYGLYLYDQNEILELQKKTEKSLSSKLNDKALIQNRYLSSVTEAADEGIGYSTRDEIRQLKTDAEIERWLKDPKVRASLQVLTSKIFSDPLVVEQKGDGIESDILKKYIQTNLNEMDGTFRKVLKEGVIAALAFQNAFFEKVPGWSENPDFLDKRIIKRYASKRPGLLEFITDDYDNIISIHSLINYNEYYDLKRFFIISFNNLFSNPYGETLFSSTYKYWEAKRTIFKLMAIYANRFSQPIPTVTYRDKDQKGIAQTLSNLLYAGINIALPEGVKAEFLTALEKGSQNPFIIILEYLDKQISLGICGIDLSQGSYAADKVIADERLQMILDIREDLEDFIYEQIIKPLCEDNFDKSIFPVSIYPRICFKAPKKQLSFNELTQALPVLIENNIIFPDRQSDLNQIRHFYDFDEIESEDEKDEYIEIDDNFQEVDNELDDFDINFNDKSNITNYPNKGDNEEIKLSKSDYPIFDQAFAENIRLNYPDIWNMGGNVRGNDAYKLLKRAVKNEDNEEVRAWIKEREAWAARHINNYRPPGIVAQIKWGVIGAQGQRYMKTVIGELIKNIDAENEKS